ncbi:MAG: hypothetical protein GXY55_03260 [Phycisphaerae bacterium]|nr:hypothetical protein [Phycisphaerae bacterium]
MGEQREREPLGDSVYVPTMRGLRVLEACVGAASAGSAAGVVLLFGFRSAPDVIGPEAYLVPSFMLSCAHAGLPIAMKRWRIALWGIVLLVPFCTLIQAVVTLWFEQNFLIGYVCAAAVCGVAAFASISCKDEALLTGAASAVVGILITFVSGWLARRAGLATIYRVDGSMLVAMLVFGPAMGLSLAIPAITIRPWHTIVCPPGQGCCPLCGYCLRGNTSGTCPECGTSIRCG